MTWTRAWEECYVLYTDDPREFWDLISDKVLKEIEVLQDLAWFVYWEIREVPDTHAGHDRLLRRLKKFLSYVREVRSDELRYERDFFVESGYSWHAYSKPIYEQQLAVLERIVSILEHYREAVKRERERIWRFLYPWVCRVLEDIANTCLAFKTHTWRSRTVEARVYKRVYLGGRYPPSHATACRVEVYVEWRKERYVLWDRKMSLEELRRFLLEKFLVRKWPKWAHLELYGYDGPDWISHARMLADARIKRDKPYAYLTSDWLCIFEGEQQ